jgi:hypothetical protein
MTVACPNQRLRAALVGASPTKMRSFSLGTSLGLRVTQKEAVSIAVLTET